MLAVVDTIVILSGLRSALGASNQLLIRAARRDFQTTISTALCMEYADVLHRPGLLPAYSFEQIERFLDSFCAISREAPIYFRWRPFLRDPGDDLVFECALASGATHIVTFNSADFAGAEDFGISVVTPSRFLGILPPP
jgi:putative PIN family toxin of toxin-antitoxin system